MPDNKKVWGRNNIYYKSLNLNTFVPINLILKWIKHMKPSELNHETFAHFSFLTRQLFEGHWS